MATQRDDDTHTDDHMRRYNDEAGRRENPIPQIMRVSITIETNVCLVSISYFAFLEEFDEASHRGKEQSATVTRSFCFVVVPLAAAECWPMAHGNDSTCICTRNRLQLLNFRILHQRLRRPLKRAGYPFPPPSPSSSSSCPGAWTDVAPSAGGSSVYISLPAYSREHAAAVPPHILPVQAFGHQSCTW